MWVRALLLCLSNLVITSLQSQGVCPRSEIACAGTCVYRISTSLNHGQATIRCRTQNKRIYMGSRVEEELESPCASSVFGDNSNAYIWSRYKLREGMVVDESGMTIDRINWGLKYCGAVDQLGNFMPHPCSWDYNAICVSNQIHFDKNDLRECDNEYYWITDRSDLNYEQALTYCRQNNMVLATPYTTARKGCFHTVMQARGISKAWIDYNITAATQRIRPWDRDYCIKVNAQNEYAIDKCETPLQVYCSSYGVLEASGVVVQKGRPAVLTCKCFNCSVSDIEWTDGMTVWRSGDNAGGFSVHSVPDTTGVRSTLTLSQTLLDQSFTCVQRTQFSDSVIYKTVNVDVYNLEVTSHYITYGSTITVTCKFNNNKHLDIDRVEWTDRRDNADLSGRARLSYEDVTVISKLEILAEYFTHDVRCTFFARGHEGGVTGYSGISRIIVYKIEGEDTSVPANANTSLSCDLREHEGRSVDLVAPTRVDWVKDGSSSYFPSEVDNPYRAVLVRNMRTGRDLYTCRFLFENGDRLTKTLTVTAFDFEGIPALVANGTTATLNCKYSKGQPPDTPLWWEREGVKLVHGKRYKSETYEITSNFVNDDFYMATTTLTIRNASYPAMYQCGLRVSRACGPGESSTNCGKVWRKEIPLGVYMGDFIAPNVTITEELDISTGEIVVNCSVWSNPRPNVQLFVDTEATEGRLESTLNKTTLTIRIDHTCDAAQLKCLASNNEGTREAVTKSKLYKKCGFFAKMTLTVKLAIGGALLFLVIVIIIICCCFCRKTKELKEEVQYQREVLSQVDGASTMYSMNLSRGKASLPPKYEDMYSEGGLKDNNYDPLCKSTKTYMELNDEDVPHYNEPFSDAGLMSPKYQRIESDYEPPYESAAPLFMRSKSRENMFSPPLMKKTPTPALSYQNLRDQSNRYPSQSSMAKTNLSRSAQNLNNRKFSQPVDKLGEPIKMNPFGNVQRMQSADVPVDDEIMSITSKIPPSEISEMTPPVAILSPRGWEIPDDPKRMFSPPTARRPREYERKFSEPSTASPWQEAQDKVRNWNLPAHPEDIGLYEKPPKSGYSTPGGPLSGVGESTGKSSATLDTISVTPTFMSKNPKPVSLPKPRPHPEDRAATCMSPVSSVGPSASQYQPSSASLYQPMYPPGIENDRQRENLKNNIFDIDDLSSVDVPDQNGMDTLDRRVKNLNPAAENFYTPSRDPTHDPIHDLPSSSRDPPTPTNAKPPQGAVKVFPDIPKKPNLRTTHF